MNANAASSFCSYITSVRIHRFLNLTDTTVTLTPCTSSFVTLVIGANNTGKTNVLRALTLWNWAHNSPKLNKTKVDEKAYSSYVSSAVELFESRNYTTPISISVSGVTITSEPFTVEYSFYYDADDDILRWKLEPHSTIEEYSPARSTDVCLSQPFTYIRYIAFIVSQRYPTTWEKIKQFILDNFFILLHPPTIGVVSDAHVCLLTYQTENQNHDLNICSLGSGALRTLAILLCASLRRCDLICLDEPDSHLEALRQTDIVRFFIEHDNELLEKQSHLKERLDVKPRQLLITSHSEVLIKELVVRRKDQNEKHNSFYSGHTFHKVKSETDEEHKNEFNMHMNVVAMGIQQFPAIIQDPADLQALYLSLNHFTLSDYHRAREHFPMLLILEDKTDLFMLRALSKLCLQHASELAAKFPDIQCLKPDISTTEAPSKLVFNKDFLKVHGQSTKHISTEEEAMISNSLDEEKFTFYLKEVFEYLHEGCWSFLLHGKVFDRARTYLKAMDFVHRSKLESVYITDSDGKQSPPNHANFPLGCYPVQWEQYELENYIFSPESIAKCFQEKFPVQCDSATVMKTLNSAHKVLEEAAKHSTRGEKWRNTKGSDIISKCFDAYVTLSPPDAHYQFSKGDYFELVSYLDWTWIHPNVVELLIFLGQRWADVKEKHSDKQYRAFVLEAN